MQFLLDGQSPGSSLDFVCICHSISDGKGTILYVFVEYPRSIVLMAVTALTNLVVQPALKSGQASVPDSATTLVRPSSVGFSRLSHGQAWDWYHANK